MSSLPTPKDRFTALDTLAVARELRALGPAHVDKAFDLPNGGWSLALRVPRIGRRELVIVPGRYVAVLERGIDHAEELTPLAKELRRLLTGAALSGVKEPGGERLLELAWSRSGEPSPVSLIVEIFGTGNLLLVRESRILAVASPRRWAHRLVRVGADYSPPPERTNPWTLDVPEIEAELARSRADIASTLAARLALGGPIAEELIARQGWNPAEATAPRASEFARPLREALAALRGEVGERPVGYLYHRDDGAVEASPYPSERWRAVPDTRETVRASFSEAAQEYFGSLIRPGPSPAEAEATRARERLGHLATQQRAAIEELATAVAALRAQAEAVLAHFPEAEAALAHARTRSDPEPIVEATLGSVTVPLRVDRDPRASAQALFEESKRVGSKLAGARHALEETEAQLSRPLESPALGPAAAAVPDASRKRTHWFEKFRWFVSSEGAIVVGGRDASSNDLVVKKHLKDRDVYVHADLHGAASVVVKRPDGARELTETTFREAGQWAVAYSKAWRAGHASGSAFWVTPDQVSKSSESGEFVARGAWVIRGTKHLMRDLPLELALGPIDYEGERLWTVAPPEALRRRGEVRVLLTPGEERTRSEREVELARDLGLSRPRLQSLLPAGGVTVRRP